MGMKNNWYLAALPLISPMVAGVAVALLFAASFQEAPPETMDPCGPTPAPSAAPCPAVSAQGWTAPTHGQVGSGFRTPDRPGHAGVDIIVPRYTVIHAASAGIVVTAKCNASTGNCDVDGSPAVKGCGWYVEIAHTTGLTTRYCHMVERPAVVVGQSVEAGQPLGKVGSSGNSSGPHLHFETRVNGEAVNPIPFMAARDAPLGKI